MSALDAPFLASAFREGVGVLGLTVRPAVSHRLPGVAAYEILHILLIDYIPFIILLWGLFTISGGIIEKGALALQGTPGINTIMLLIGTLLASWIVTTGASMVMIRPLLQASKNRFKKAFRYRIISDQP